MGARPTMTTFGLAAAMGLGVAFVTFGGCGLSTEGIPGAEVARPCEGPEDCDDSNLCTVNNCGPNKRCLFTPTQGVEPPDQTLGDCKHVTCDSGKQIEAPEDTDKDDNNSCTDDHCSAGVGTHTPLAEGTSCTLGSLTGTCQSGGCVVTCTSVSDKCDDNNLCTEDSCNVGVGKCENTKLHGTVVADPSSSDCIEVRCVNGVATTVPDDAEIPDDGFECTTDTCSSTAALHKPVPTGTACGAAMDQKCNPAGICVGCNGAEDCGGTSDSCKTITCKNRSCGVDYVASGTPLPVGEQTHGDCQKLQCGDMGTVGSVDDNADIPDDDGNECTVPTCSSGAPAFAAVADGTACSGGTCIAGSCCIPKTCDALGIHCGTPSDTCGGTLVCSDGQKNDSETDVDCGGASCPKCGQGQTCLATSDCSTPRCTDGFCCNSTCTGTCRACALTLTGQPNGSCAAIPAGFDDNSPVCGGSFTCDGQMNCVNKKKSGAACSSDSECASDHCPSPEHVCCDTSCATKCMSCKGSSTGLPNGICGAIQDQDPEGECPGNQCCQGSNNCGGNSC